MSIFDLPIPKLAQPFSLMLSAEIRGKESINLPQESINLPQDT